MPSSLVEHEPRWPGILVLLGGTIALNAAITWTLISRMIDSLDDATKDIKSDVAQRNATFEREIDAINDRLNAVYRDIEQN